MLLIVASVSLLYVMGICVGMYVMLLNFHVFCRTLRNHFYVATSSQTKRNLSQSPNNTEKRKHCPGVIKITDVFGGKHGFTCSIPLSHVPSVPR